MGGGALPQLFVPVAALDAVQVPLQTLVALLVVADLVGDGGAVAGVQLVDEVRNEVLVLDRLLDRRQGGARGLALARGLRVGVGRVGIGRGALAPELVLEDVQVEVAQGIRAEAAALEALVLGDVRVALQQLRDPAEDVRGEAMGVQRLEQQQRLEVGVGSQAGIHPPGPLQARRGREGRQHGRLEGDRVAGDGAPRRCDGSTGGR